MAFRVEDQEDNIKLTQTRTCGGLLLMLNTKGNGAYVYNLIRIAGHLVLNIRLIEWHWFETRFRKWCSKRRLSSASNIIDRDQLPNTVHVNVKQSWWASLESLDLDLKAPKLLSECSQHGFLVCY